MLSPVVLMSFNGRYEYVKTFAEALETMGSKVVDVPYAALLHQYSGDEESLLQQLNLLVPQGTQVLILFSLPTVAELGFLRQERSQMRVVYPFINTTPHQLSTELVRLSPLIDLFVAQESHWVEEAQLILQKPVHCLPSLRWWKNDLTTSPPEGPVRIAFINSDKTEQCFNVPQMLGALKQRLIANHWEVDRLSVYNLDRSDEEKYPDLYLAGLERLPTTIIDPLPHWRYIDQWVAQGKHVFTAQDPRKSVPVDGTLPLGDLKALECLETNVLDGRSSLTERDLGHRGLITPTEWLTRVFELVVGLPTTN